MSTERPSRPAGPAGAEWFARARFGLFIHWGLYAIPAWHEQIQSRKPIARREYEALAGQFNPRDFDPHAWLDQAQRAGMKYLVFTTKHHDGFCLWDSACTDFKVTNTPCRRDLLDELAQACHQRNLPLGLYYSVVDWHHKHYPNQGRHHELPPQPDDEPDMPRYVEYLRAQIEELMTGYGPIRYLFWDMNVPEYHDPGIHEMIRRLQPGILINDRGFHDRTDPRTIQRQGLVVTPEREYQNQQRDAKCERFAQPTEACNALDSLSWGYRDEPDYYSLRHIESQMADTLARGGNYLLNVGPDASGCIPPGQADRLDAIGRWYTRLRPALHAEPASRLVDNDQVLITRHGEVLYVILHRCPHVEAVRLPPLQSVPARAVLLNDGRELPAVVDRLPMDKTGPWLRIRQIPVNELAGQVLAVRLEFDKPILRGEGTADVEQI